MRPEAVRFRRAHKCGLRRELYSQNLRRTTRDYSSLSSSDSKDTAMTNLKTFLILTAALATLLPACDDSADPVESNADAAAGKSDAEFEACDEEDIEFLADAANSTEAPAGPGSRVNIDQEEWDKAVEEEDLPASCAADVVLGSGADGDKAVDSYGNICGGCWCDDQVCWEETGNITCDEGWCSCDYLLNDCI